jgi:hypothetical protein
MQYNLNPSATKLRLFALLLAYLLGVGSEIGKSNEWENINCEVARRSRRKKGVASEMVLHFGIANHLLELHSSFLLF